MQLRASLGELHDIHPHDENQMYWHGPETLEQAISLAGDLHTATDPIAHLDAIREKDYGHGLAINQALRFLPPEIVVDKLGEDIAFWTSASTGTMGQNDPINEALWRLRGYDIDDLEIARGWNWRQRYSRDIKSILAQYHLMQSLKHGVLDDVDLPEALGTSVRDGVKLSSDRLKDYDVVSVQADEYNNYYDGGIVSIWNGKKPNLYFNIWLDSPVGFVLTYKGMPNAVAALAMRGPDTVMVHQLQGIRGNKLDPTASRYASEAVIGRTSARGLAPFDWQKVMVTITEQIVAKHGANVAAIQSAANNVWTRERMPSDKEPHLPLEAAVLIYDQLAARLGYSKDLTESDANWVKTLHTI